MVSGLMTASVQLKKANGGGGGRAQIYLEDFGTGNTPKTSGTWGC